MQLEGQIEMPSHFIPLVAFCFESLAPIDYCEIFRRIVHLDVCNEASALRKLFPKKNIELVLSRKVIFDLRKVVKDDTIRTSAISV
jgi:hypothetical protein